ncbi:anthranilate synthase component I [Candidatus Marinamargulisbacteria bacterium SCGC AG-343-D04]|nr:anthranilate synthase component I [Candidatus Marinamargulisbacteria bacterium SCGC AG-343-D04]
MLVLSFKEFLSLSQTYNVIPLFEDYVYDAHTALTAFSQFKDQDSFVFLEGVSIHEHHGRYSYLAISPHCEVNVFESHYNVIKDAVSTRHSGGVYDALNNLLDFYSYPETLPDFYSGILGNLTYESVIHLESISLPSTRALDTPYASLMIPKTLLIFDKLYHTLTISRSVFIEDKNVSEKELEHLYNEALNDIMSVKAKCESPKMIEPVFLFNSVHNYQELKYECNIDKPSFLGQVERCKRYIEDGDIFQIQVSRRASIPYEKDPFLLYRYLRNFNPSPLLFYLKLSGSSLVGASPEILVNVENNKMSIRPIAGTRKRYSKDKTEDEIINELVTDPKEKAEHIMLVDLARNDVGRACDIDSVNVNELMITEKYAHVIHMVSDVSGTLKSTCNAVDALKYGFPAGTVTGAPKIRAMEIISECEMMHREFYSGGIVFFDFKNNLKSALTIRSILVKDKMAYTQAAAGVVADSIPEMEFKETENKMRSCLSAMVQCGESE